MRNTKKDSIATINDNGAILLGNFIEVDGFARRPIRVITHFHSDHLIDINKSKKYAKQIVATAATFEALEVLGYKLPLDKKVTLSYNKPMKVNVNNNSEEQIIFIPSRHVFGSTQVLVETKKDIRVGYTSDFKLPNTRIMTDLDVLVIDATYGGKNMVRPFKREIEYILTDIVYKTIKWKRPVRIFGYYGKLQEVMEILRKKGITAPFIMPEKIYQLTKIAIKHGLEITDLYRYYGFTEKEYTKECKKECKKKQKEFIKECQASCTDAENNIYDNNYSTNVKRAKKIENQCIEKCVEKRKKEFLEKCIEEAKKTSKIMKTGYYVYFQHMNSKKKIPTHTIDIYLSGWLFSAPAKKIINGAQRISWWISFSDHGDFEDTVKYVEKASPKKLIVDSFRTDVKIAEEFASYIEKELGIKTIVLPGSKGKVFRED